MGALVISSAFECVAMPSTHLPGLESAFLSRSVQRRKVVGRDQCRHVFDGNLRLSLSIERRGTWGVSPRRTALVRANFSSVQQQRSLLQLSVCSTFCYS